MRVLLLLALLAGLGVYVYQQRQANYPVSAVTTPTGRAYEAVALPKTCPQGLPTCAYSAAYLTSLTDTAAIKEEARLLIPWLEKQAAMEATTTVLIIAVEPGFLRFVPPKSALGLAFVRHQGMSDWVYAGMEDLTPSIKEYLNQS
jgi:hypothetical protein